MGTCTEPKTNANTKNFLSLFKGQECRIVCIDTTCIFCFVLDFNFQSLFIQYFPSFLPPSLSFSVSERMLVGH